MLEAKKTNEGIVTSLADSDLVMAATSGGKFSPISVANLMNAIRDNIKIGGRNLIPDSAKFTGWSAKQTGYIPDGTDGILSVRKSTGAFLGAYRSMSFVAGATYTFSVYTDSPNEMTLYIKYVNDNYGSQTADFGTPIRTYRQISQDWYQISVTAMCTKSGSALIELESNNIPSTQTVRYCAPKLEVGTIPTDWSPAPEDLSGGVILTDSIGYDLKKGGRHDRGENTHRRSYTLLSKDGVVRGIAARSDADRPHLSGCTVNNRRYDESRCLQNYGSDNGHPRRSLCVCTVDSHRHENSLSSPLHSCIGRRRNRGQQVLAYTDNLGRNSKSLAQNDESILVAARKEVVTI